MGADIATAEAVDKAGLHHHFERLAMRAAENDGAAGGLEALDDALEGVERGGVHGGDELHPENEDAGQTAGP